MHTTSPAEVSGFRQSVSTDRLSPEAGAAACMIWSATPTPFTNSLAIDHASIQRMVDHHDILGIDGIFLAGTCGEGPWLNGRQTVELIQSASDANHGRMKLGVQVTENSVARTLERLDLLEQTSYDFAVIAQPALFMNATPSRIISYYLDILDRSPKPVCFYDRGSRPDFPMEPQLLLEIYSHPKIRIVKDSSRCPTRREIALGVRAERNDLALLNGDEFDCFNYFAVGYDGFMTGGAILTGAYLRRQASAYREGNLAQSKEIDQRAQHLLKTVYGGESLSCWLTGLKQSLVELGVFSSAASYLEYPLTEECRNNISRIVREESEWLLPDTTTPAAA